MLLCSVKVGKSLCTAIIITVDKNYVHLDVSIENHTCIDGEVQLVSSSNPLEGRVEVCINRAWGTICDNGFNTEDATVICNQLEVPYISEFYFSNIQGTL